MGDALQLGLGRHMLPIPRFVWQPLVEANARRTGARIAFMSQDHHRVRDHAVTELARSGAPLGPEAIGEALGLDRERVGALLDELEAHLTFLFRNERGEVTWAYPVTVDETAHRARFSTGEEAYSP